ncbi:MAG TPA: hypothetical protein VIF62_25245 [Labilithrix sp.]
MAATILLIGCKDKDPGPTLAPSASSLSASTPAPTTNTILKLVIDPKSKATIDMPAPKEHIKAYTDAAAGSFDVDVMNLANSRGEVKMDLSTITMNHFESAKDNESQTTHARCWLEVADCEDQKLPDDVKAANKYAVYAIRSVDNLSATDLGKVATTKDADDDVRDVKMTGHGEVLIHGHKVDRDADLDVAFHYAPGAAADKPKLVVVKSVKPFRITLAEHDVKPRDNVGKIAKASFHLLGTKVADTADISLEIRAMPQP